MYIAIHCAGMPFDGNTIPSGQSLGGSESAAYYMAKELVKLGHAVTVFSNHQHKNARGEIVGQYWDGVLYEWLGIPTEFAPLGDRFEAVMQVPFDICIIQRHPQAFIKPINAKLTYWWLHDLATYPFQGMVQQHLVNIDKILCVSEFHKKQVSKVYDIPLGSIIATTNGVDYSLYEGLDGIEREPRSLFYMARPERGLENLVGEDGIMEELKDCHLYVCGYNNTVPAMADYYNYLWQRCQMLPNVTNLGHLGKRQLYEAMAHAELYVYPTTFEDTSCIAALEANAAGLPVIGSNWSATPETLTGGGYILLDLVDGNVDRKAFAKEVRAVLSQPTKLESLRKKALAKRQTWEAAARQWDESFKTELEIKSSDKKRLVKHLEQMSDIVAIDKGGMTGMLPDYDTTYGFYKDNDLKGHYEKYYNYEKDRGVNYGPEDLFSNNRFQCCFSKIMEVRPSTILDFGCAHGLFTMNILGRALGVNHITGIDISQLNIEASKKWAAEAGFLNRSDFIVGDLEYMKAHPELKYDMILFSEVMEHVPDPQEHINELMTHLNDGGTILGTTPYGPWEAIGYKEHYPWRAHIHHFERQDLQEMFGHFDNYKVVSVPHGYKMGHLIWTFSKSDKPCGEIDYARKLKSQAPQETVSVCMIAYNEEDSIGKTLKNISAIADEIIVGIDENTTDRTEDICRKYGARTFRIESPLKQGFDGARNQTIAEASMDWILWIDADETLEGIENLHFYLRPNCYSGYAIQQHHFACEPAGLIQTDMPVRLFRNHRGAKFYGLVHEHPEYGINSGIGKVTVLGNVWIMHTGYSTEAIRRKRFLRNWPLMIKDREKYPDRILGKFLWIRDLAHHNRYIYEQTKGVTPEMDKAAREAITLWHELLKDGHPRMVVESLVYYTQAVELITRGRGIRYAVDMSASKLNGGPKLPNQPIQAMFETRKDIEELTALLINANIGNFEDRYYA